MTLALPPVVESLKSVDPKGPIVFIGTPAYDGWKGRYVPSLIETMRDLAGRGFRCRHFSALSCSLTTNARCELLGVFLASEAEWFVGIDNDIGWPADLIARMIALGEPMTCAAVPYRKIDVDVLSHGGSYSDAIEFNVEPQGRQELLAMPTTESKLGDTFRRVNDVGTAFYVVRRDAFLAMGRRYHDLEIDVTGFKSYALYKQEVEGRRLKGEDRCFFARWHAIGGQTWCIEDAELTHTGPVPVGGNLAHHLRGTVDPARRYLAGNMHKTAGLEPTGKNR